MFSGPRPGMGPPKRATGRVCGVQEERFRLIQADGRGLLLTLSPRAGVSAEALLAYAGRGTAIAVEYTGEPNLDTGIARRVREAP